MALRTGLASQLGMVSESAYGTAVTVTRFYDYLSQNIKTRTWHPEVQGMGSGRFQRSDRVGPPVIIGAAGDTEFEVANKGFGLLLKHMLGANTVAQVGETAEYTHTCIPDANGMAGLSASVQTGVPGVDGTVRAFSFEGGKILNWSINQQLDSLLKFKTTWDFEDVVTSTALASASYAAAREWFHHANLAVTIDATPIYTRSLVINGDNGLGADNRRGAGRLKKEPLPESQMMVTGTLDAEFTDLSMYAALVAGTTMKLVATWTGSTIPEESNPFKIVATIEEFKLTGDPPEVTGTQIVRQPLNFKALSDGTEPLIEVVYHTTDTAA